MAGYTREEALEYIRENDIRFIRLAFCDMFGNHKNIAIQPDILEEAFDNGIYFDSLFFSGFNDPQYKDLYLVPDPKTLSPLPWRPQAGGVVRFYCDVVTADGNPYPYDARHFLRETKKKCRKYGFMCRVGMRGEFYLFKNDEDGNPTTEPMDNGTYLDVAPLDKGENIRREICFMMSDMGLMPKLSHHEAGPGQNEIDFRAAGAVDCADHFITYKNIVETIAAKNGVTASFEPKPLEGRPGNGLHLNISLYNETENLYETQPEVMDYFMAGVFNRMRDITVFLNTRKDSYLRFGENEAPKYITWSQQNRSRLMRVPIVRGKKNSFILRSPDSMLNPYLAVAMVIQAGLAGVDNKESLPPALELNDRDLTDDERSKSQMLPLSLAEAVNCAKNSEFVSQFDIAKKFIEVVSKKEI